MIRLLAVVAALGCNAKDKDHAVGVSKGDRPAVILHLAPDAIEVEGKNGKHTFQIESEPTPALVKPVVDAIMEAGGKDGIQIWGRYAAPDVYKALQPGLDSVPTTVCLRDGNNC